MQNITTCLWFAKNAKQAVEFYTSLIPNSAITSISHYPFDSLPEHGNMKEGDVLTIMFTLNGTQYMALNGGADFPHTFAASLTVPCDTQEEIDRYYDALGPGGGGKEVECGWVTDKFGLAWQIYPKKMDEFLAGPNKAKATAAMREMMTMKKLNLARIEAAYNAA